MIEIIFYDFDGVMTDNYVYVTDAIIGNGGGHEFVRCCRADGYAVDRIREMGVFQVIVSAEKNPVVKNRANKLGLEVYTGIRDKAKFVKKFCSDHKFDLKNAAFVGNGLNDLEAMRLCGQAFCPSNAVLEVKYDFCVEVLKTKGGDGVVYDLWKLAGESFLK